MSLAEVRGLVKQLARETLAGSTGPRLRDSSSGSINCNAVDRRSPRLASDQSGVSDLLEVTVSRRPGGLWI
jgi:hypothetical protein